MVWSGTAGSGKAGQGKVKAIFRDRLFYGRDLMRAIIVGTGPSLNDEALQLVNASSLPKFGCNNVYQDVQLTALLSCNEIWWSFYWQHDEALRNGDFEKWTWDKPTAERYGLSHISGKWGDGLSTDPEVIFYGHSSGYQLLGLALHHGITEFILIGYDLRFPKDYDGTKQITGGDRHYFGEYPKELQHWTRFHMGKDGELNGLLDCYRTIEPSDYGIRIINCSPGSALDFFETGELSEWI